MGYRIHVATTYEVKYGCGELSNKQEAINRLLSDNCSDLHWNDKDGAIFSSELQVPRTQLAQLISILVSNRTHFEKWCRINDIGVSLDELVVIISRWIAESDYRNPIVVLSWY